MCLVVVVAHVSPSSAPIQIGLVHQFVLNVEQNPKIALKNGAIMSSVSFKLDNAVQHSFWDGLHGFIACSRKE